MEPDPSRVGYGLLRVAVLLIEQAFVREPDPSRVGYCILPL